MQGIVPNKKQKSTVNKGTNVEANNKYPEFGVSNRVTNGLAAQFGYDLQQGCTNPWGTKFYTVTSKIFGIIIIDFTPTYKNVYHCTCDEQKAPNNRFTGHPRIVGLQYGN